MTIVLVTNRVPVARFGPKLSQNESYRLQEPFNVFYFVLYAFTGPGVRRRNRAEIDPAGWAKALSRNCKKPLTPTQSKCLPQVVASSALSALAQDPVGAEAAVNS